MSVLPNQTNINATDAFFLRANAQQVNASTISTGFLNAGTVSTQVLDANAANFSTTFAYEMFIDNQGLTATPTELLLNGVPLATTANLSSIQDWAIYDAISTVNMAGNNLLSTNNIVAQNILTQNLVAYNTIAISSFTSTISSLSLQTDALTTSSINGQPFDTSGNLTLSSLTANTSVSTPSFFVSSINGQPISFYEPGAVSTISSFDTLSASSFSVSSINGHEFTTSSITVNTIGASSLITTSVSTISAEIRQGLMSSIQFNPSLGGVSLGGVNLGLGSILGNVIGWGAGVFGAAAGAVGMITGTAALMNGRPGNNINNNSFELINGTTQLQFSTLGSTTTSIQRFVSSSGDPSEIPGEEYFISTILPAGTHAVRSFSDPLNTMSSPTSTVQSFGQWVEVPFSMPSSISSINNWAEFPANSTIAFAPGTPAVLQTSGPASSLSLRADTGVEIQNYAGNAYANLTADGIFGSSATASTLTTGEIVGSATDMFGIPGYNDGLIIRASTLAITSTPLIVFTGNLNASSCSFFQGNIRDVIASTITTSTLTATTIPAVNCSSIVMRTPGPAYTLSSIINLAPGAGGPSQTSTTTVLNTDLSVGTNDIIAGQLRLAGTGSGVAEIVMTGPDARVFTYDVNTADVTLRQRLGTNPALSTGYFLDTYANPPFFSTLAGVSTAMMAYFPSTTSNTIGISTISFIPDKTFVGSWYSSTSQTVAGANTITPLTHNTQTINIGGFAYQGSTITLPVGGTYEITGSIQFDTTSGGTNEVDFWLMKNGTDLVNSASKVSIVNNGETLGTISLIDTFAANDQVGWRFASADANMTAAFFNSTITTPYTRPGVPSVITNIKRLG